MSPSRRDVLRALAAAGALGFGDAKASTVLDAGEVRILAAVAEAMVPGAVRAGVVAFVTEMLGSERPMQFYGYMNFPMPPAAFYTAALQAVAAFSLAQTGRAVDKLTVTERRKLLLALLAPDVPGWSGPPSPLVYLVLRNDAIDVVYGGAAAYDELGLPYMAHIAPPRPW